jgi:glycosyltransferase involved in cell wall biosynthesis
MACRATCSQTRSNRQDTTSQQGNLFVNKIKQAGHDIAVNAICDQYQTGVDANGITHFASGPNGGLAGNDFFSHHVEHYKPDIVISVNDVYMCKPELFDKTQWYPWVMVDSEPLLWEIRECLKACQQPIAPTQYAAGELKRWGHDSAYIPMAYDGAVYYPADRAEARAWLSKTIDKEIGPETFVAVCNSANHSSPSRKNFGALFHAWSLFERQYPDSLLYVHTDIGGHVMCDNGEYLPRVKETYGATNVVFAPQYEYNTGLITGDYLRGVYNASDVLINTSMGEGFGIPIIEAQACGCPVIVPDFGNTAELCKSGIKCRGVRWMYRAGTEQFIVDPQSVADALIYLAEEPIHKNREIVARLVSDYEISNVFDKYMAPWLEEVAP